MVTVSDIVHNADAFRRAYPDFGRNQSVSEYPSRENENFRRQAITADAGITISDTEGAGN